MVEQSFNKGIKASFQMITVESTFNSTVYSSPKKRIVGQGSIISCMGRFVVKKKKTGVMFWNVGAYAPYILKCILHIF
jgi:hypothetical protein